MLKISFTQVGALLRGSLGKGFAGLAGLRCPGREMGQGPSAHTSMLSITNAQAAAFFPGKAVQWPAGPASYSESGKLFFLSLAREPQSLLVCGSPPVQVICLLVNI